MSAGRLVTLWIDANGGLTAKESQGYSMPLYSAAEVEVVLEELRPLLLTYPHYQLCATNRDLLDGGAGECNCRKAEATRLLAALEGEG